MRLLLFASAVAAGLHPAPHAALSPVVTVDLSFGEPTTERHVHAFSLRDADAAASRALQAAWEDCSGAPQRADLHSQETSDGFTATLEYRCES